MTDKGDMNNRVGRLIDAATEHVKTHGLAPSSIDRKAKVKERRGRVGQIGRDASRSVLPGLPVPAPKGSHISMSMNDSCTRVKLVVSVNGVKSWIILNKSQLARFMAGCADTIQKMVEE
jgi:hypothetical protein